MTPVACVLIALYVVASLFVVPPGRPTEFNFVDERGAVTALSAVLLAMGSGFALVCLLVGPTTDRRQQLTWLVLACGIGFLALDELLEFHERVGDRIDALGLSAGPVRHWNDVIVVLYGVIAVAGAAFVLPVLKSHRGLPTLLVAAFACYVVHTVVDSFVEPPTTFSVVCEESAKLYCSTLVALSMLAGLVSCVSKQPVESSRPHAVVADATAA